MASSGARSAWIAHSDPSLATKTLRKRGILLHAAKPEALTVSHRGKAISYAVLHLAAHYRHGTVSVDDHLSGHGADQPALEHTPTTMAHDNMVDSMFLRIE